MGHRIHEHEKEMLATDRNETRNSGLLTNWAEEQAETDFNHILTNDQQSITAVALSDAYIALILLVS